MCQSGVRRRKLRAWDIIGFENIRVTFIPFIMLKLCHHHPIPYAARRCLRERTGRREQMMNETREQATSQAGQRVDDCSYNNIIKGEFCSGSSCPYAGEPFHDSQPFSIGVALAAIEWWWYSTSSSDLSKARVIIFIYFILFFEYKFFAVSS